MTATKRRPSCAGVLAAALLLWMAHAGAAPATAAQILDAADHAELAARVSATGVSRVALLGDRIARVIRAPGGYQVEHDPGTGDLYLRPLPESADGTAPGLDRSPGQALPVALFVGTEKGFTYRLTLTPAERGPAQILIRNADIVSAETAETIAASDARIAAIARLIRAVANREPLAGYTIEGGGNRDADNTAVTVVEVWRGPRFSGWVVELGVDAPRDPEALAARLGPDIAAVWLADTGTGPRGGRFAVAVREGVSR